MLLKWSLDSIECVGSVQKGSFHGPYCAFLLALMTPVDPILSDAETLSIIGLIKGANSDKMNKVRVSLIFSTRASSPGILAIVAFIAFTKRG